MHASTPTELNARRLRVVPGSGGVSSLPGKGPVPEGTVTFEASVNVLPSTVTVTDRFPPE